MNWKFLPLVISVLVAAPYQAARGEVIEDVRYGPSCNPRTHYCGLIIKLQGEITVADYEKAKRLIDQTHRQAESKNWAWDGIVVYLDTPGGNVDAAMAIGRLLRKEQAIAHIGYMPLHTQGICYSACVLVLAGAVNRQMQDGKVGIHRPYYEVPKDKVSPDKISELYQKMLQDIRAYFHEMNVSEQLADAMLRINPENMRLLNNAELNNYGLTYEDPIARETEELKIAQQLGLSRQEYMRRKILAKSRCGGEISSKCYQHIIDTGQVSMQPPTPEELAPDFTMYGR